MKEWIAVAMLVLVVFGGGWLIVNGYRRFRAGRYPRLDSPVKRAGAIVFWTGVAVLAYTAIRWGADSGDDFFGKWWGSLTQSYSDYRRFPGFRWGTMLAVPGLLMSYAYDATLRRMVGWIRHGSTPRA